MDNYYFLEMELTQRQEDFLREAKYARLVKEAREGESQALYPGKAAARKDSRSPIRQAVRWVPHLLARLFIL